MSFCRYESSMSSSATPADATPAKSSDALRFSLRDMFIAFAAVSCFLGGYVAFGYLGASVVAATSGLALMIRGRRSANKWVGRAGAYLFLPSFPICVMLLVARILFGIGPMYTPGGWPNGLESMAKTAGADTSDIKAACLGRFIDAEYAWRMQMPPNRLEAVALEFQLSDVAAGGVPADFWKAFPFWWRPVRSGTNRYLSTAGFPAPNRGPDGEHYFALYDAPNEMLYVWCKSNF
jgi:hypothetical protein